MEEQVNSMPLIGEKAPAFEAETTQGMIKFPDDFKGKWVIFFSHPADFTPVCTTEFMTFASMENEFKKLIAWLRTIKEKIKYKQMESIEVNFPVISDLTMDVSKKFGMLQPAASTTQAVRAVFIIDPKAVVRAILYYPLSNGRNMDEVKRLLIAMQHSDEHNIATPANWRIGDDVIVPPPGSCGTAKERVDKAGDDYDCLDWFICLKKCPHGK